MKIVFMGTPEFAATALCDPIKYHEITAVITQPDKPAQRGKKLKCPPVKEMAVAHGIEVYQPKKIKTKEFVGFLSQVNADIFVVAAYGQLLSKEILGIPKYGAVNIHASLLPKYRGAAPIQWAIINGETQTGITIMQMDMGLDTGPMLFKLPVAIAADETGASLHDKLAQAGALAILKALELIEAGNTQPIPQNDALSTYAAMLKKETGRIHWQRNAEEIERLIRGLYPWPSAFSSLDGFGVVKVIKATALSHTNKSEPGTIIDIDKKRGLVVACGDSSLLIEKIQVGGKKAMAVPAFLLGNGIETGLKFF